MSRKPPKSTKREYPRKKQPRIIPAVTGNWRCSYRWCVVCPKIKEGSSFRSKVTGREYPILSPASCYTRSCIYLITCTKPTCGKQYVGKCKPSLAERHNGHMKEIRDQSTDFGRHFGGPGEKKALYLRAGEKKKGRGGGGRAWGWRRWGSRHC